MSTESPIDPFEPLERLLERLLAGAFHLGVGLVLGGLAVGLLRRRRLHWAWAPLAAGVSLALHSLLGGWGTTLTIAAIWATIRSRRLHNADLRVGSDVAELARARRSPLSAVHGLMRRWGANSPCTGVSDRLVLGHTDVGESVSIPLGVHEGRHALVLGATGSGKTVTQSRLLAGAIERGLGAIVIDPKGDASLREALAGAARSGGRRLIEFSAHGPSVYNPLAHGTPSQIADRALAGERFTEPHYQRQAQRYLAHAVRVLRGAGRQASLAELARLLDPDSLELLIRELPPDRAEPAHAYLDSLTPRQRVDLAGVRDRLAILAESDAGRWLDPTTATDGVERFDLLTAMRERAVVRFVLEADAWPLLAGMLAAAIVQDLLSAVAELQRRPVPTLVAIDEFSAVSPEHVVRLFARARSAGVSLLLGTQEISDLRLPGAERAQEQMLGNVSTLIVHRQALPASAELLSSIVGSGYAWRGSQSSSGRWTQTRVRQPLLDAELIRTLPRGWAAVIEPDSPAFPPIVHIDAPTTVPVEPPA